MRLQDAQLKIIREIVHAKAGADVAIALFGSRLDDAARGGDVDLLLTADRPIDLLTRARIKSALEAALGLPVDVLACQTGVTQAPFQSIASLQARLL